MRVGCIIVVLLSAGIACGQTISADFENFIEGDHFRPSFTDPHSGIFFTNSTAANQNFVIEYANDPRSSFYSNNKFLSANGLSFGPGFGLPGNFGFTAILPNFASRVTLDAGVSDTLNALCTLTLTGYDSTNRGFQFVQRARASVQPNRLTDRFDSLGHRSHYPEHGKLLRRI